MISLLPGAGGHGRRGHGPEPEHPARGLLLDVEAAADGVGREDHGHDLRLAGAPDRRKGRPLRHQGSSQFYYSLLHIWIVDLLEVQL